MNYAVKWEWNRHCDQSAGQKAKSGAPISSLSPYCPDGNVVTNPSVSLPTRRDYLYDSTGNDRVRAVSCADNYAAVSERQVVA